MSEDVILQIAVQVPALFIMGYFSLRVITLIMDNFGRKLDRAIDLFERGTKEMLAVIEELHKLEAERRKASVRVR